ncbi:MAG: DMT family transporter [Candidatus Aenigmarchaeota archaeon]|nr:DMT family transporter [Candidatus Aenigmarchaeota archaeon]
MDESKKGFLLIIISMLIFGFYGIFIKAIALSPQVLLFFFQVFGAIGSLLLLLHYKMKFSIKGFVLLLLGLAAVALLNDLLYFNAFKLTTISNSILVHYTAPIFVAVLAPFLLKEKLERITIAALMLSFFGLLLILYSSLNINTSWLGILFALASGVMYAFMIIAYKKILRHLGVYVVNFYRFVLGTLVLLPFVLIEKPVFMQADIYWLIIFGLVFAILAVSLNIEGIKRVKAQHVGIIGYMEPVAGTLYAILLLSEIPTLFTLIGGAFIILGGYLVIRAKD